MPVTKSPNIHTAYIFQIPISPRAYTHTPHVIIIRASAFIPPPQSLTYIDTPNLPRPSSKVAIDFDLKILRLLLTPRPAGANGAILYARRPRASIKSSAIAFDGSGPTEFTSVCVGSTSATTVFNSLTNSKRAR